MSLLALPIMVLRKEEAIQIVEHVREAASSIQMDYFAHSGQHPLGIQSATSKDDIMVLLVTALSMGTGIYTANKNPTEFKKFGEAGLIVARSLKGNSIKMAKFSSTPFDRGDDEKSATTTIIGNK
jgi:hypothetical protein